MPVYLLSTVPCCSTAGVVWRPPHPPRAGSACPGTPLFPPQRQLGRSNPKPGNRPGISSLSPQVTDPPAVQVRDNIACPKLVRSSQEQIAPCCSNPIPSQRRQSLGRMFPVHLPLPREKVPDPGKEMRKGLTLCPSPMTR